MILVMSFGATLASAIWLIVRWDEVNRLMRLRADKGILARWNIDPARWEWFRYHSGEWDKREGVRPNNADLTQDPGEAGIDIVVTRGGVLIGADFKPVEKDVKITARRASRPKSSRPSSRCTMPHHRPLAPGSTWGWRFSSACPR